MAFEITIPRLGWSMEEGIFAGWLKKDGDLVRRGESLFELEGEKALQEIEALDEGILRIPPSSPASGCVLKVGAVVGYLIAEGEPLPWLLASDQAIVSGTVDAPFVERDATQQESFAASPTVRRLARQLDVPMQRVVGTGPSGRITEDDVHRASQTLSRHTLSEVSTGTFPGSDEASSVSSAAQSVKEKFSDAATPRARRVAQKLQLDWTIIPGTGRGGRVRERDILAAAANTQGDASPPTSKQNPTERSAEVPGGASGSRRVPLSSRRQTIAARLTESVRQTVPVTITSRATATNLLSLRQQFKSAGHAPVPAIHDIVAKLVAMTLRHHLMLAARWDGDAIVMPDPDRLHIGIAVDTTDGLLVPVLRNVSTQHLAAICQQSARLIEKARAGRMSGTDLQDAVFSISNLGSFGIDAFTPIINFPETAILGLGAIRKEAAFSADGHVTTQEMMTLSLTFDHRVIDGAPAARFLQALVKAIENPAAQLLAGE